MYDNMATVNKLRSVQCDALVRECIKLVGREKYDNDLVDYNCELVLRWPLVCKLLAVGKPISKRLMM